MPEPELRAPDTVDPPPPSAPPVAAPHPEAHARLPDSAADLLQAYEDLAASEARYRLLAENAADIVVHADARGIYTWVSPSITRLLGWTPEDIVGRPIAGLLHPDDVAALRTSGFERRAVEVRGRVRTKDGPYRWMASRSYPVRADDGTTTGYVSAIRDVQVEVEAEERARASEVDLHAALDAMLDPYTVMEAMRDDDGRVVDFVVRYANDAACAWFGRDRSALVGAGLLAVIGQERGPAVIARYAAAVEAQRPLTVDDQVSQSGIGGHGRTYDVRAVATGDRLSLTWRDVTERTRAVASLADQAAELERRVEARTAELRMANEELESFTYTVSHDLRAPVRAIAGFARLLQRGSGPSLDELGQHRLDNIAVSAETMGRLIDDLLRYSRIGRREVRSEPVPIGPIVERLRAMHHEAFTESGGRLELAAGEAVPLADPTLLEEILINLVNNAIAYRRLDVPPVITVTALPLGMATIVSVADNGQGIPAELRERIFEVFTRTSDEHDLSHAGIGLATVRRAARAMGTDVTVASEVGVGSTFSLVLPRA